jgi:Zn-dependent protease with chaperone function
MKKNILIILALAAFNLCRAETHEYENEFTAFYTNKKRAYDCNLNHEKLDDEVLENANNENYKWYNLSQYKNRFLSFVLKAGGGIDTKKEDFPKLHKFVEDLCIKHNIEKPCIVVFPDSAEPNAWACQLFNQKGVIAINGGLIYSMNDDEIKAVLAHEIGHIKYNHVNKKMMINYGSLFATYTLIKTCLKSEIFDKSWQNKSFIPLITANIISRLITIRIMRKYETQADEFSHVNGHAKGLKNFLTKIDPKKMLRDQCKQLEFQIKNHHDPEFINACQNALRNLNILEASISLLEFVDEHPTFAERIKAAQEYLDKQSTQEQLAAT